MTKLIKLAVAAIVIAGIAYFAFVVSLGEKTLFEHLVGIAGTDEAKKLESELETKVKTTAQGVSKEIKQRAKELADVKDKIVSGDSDQSQVRPRQKKTDEGTLKVLDPPTRDKKGPSEQDRQALNRLVKEKNRKIN